MDPTGLDISEHGSDLVPFQLSAALGPHLQRCCLLCRLYALPYCTTVAPPDAYGTAPAPPQYAAAASGHADAAPATDGSYCSVPAPLGLGFHDAARPCRSPPTPAGFATSRAARSVASTKEQKAG